MKSDLITIILGFIEGFALIISPCILPILLIILAGSLSGSKKRPLGIVIGFTLSFALFAYFSRQFVQHTGIDLNLIRHISYLFLLLFGLIMMSSFLSEKFSQLTQGFAGLGSTLSSGSNPQGGFLSGVFLGGLVAIIWTPCAGPILAAVIVQTVLQKTTLTSFFTLLAFALGATIPMIIIAFYGKTLMDTFGIFKTKAVLFRKLLGAIIIASVVYMVYSEGGFVSSSIAQTTIKTSTSLEDGLWRPYSAPEIEGIEAWINSPPLKISELKGKVVLIDFWTYSCINCIRTLPYIKSWYSKYHDKGLVIIGVHSPEFDFEKNLDNVENAVKRDGILYPVALDNRFVTWSNFGNHFWPAHYLIDKEGKVVYEHFGEGAYDVTENNIRFLLGVDDLSLVKAAYNSEPYTYYQTPETYLGYGRADRNLSPYLTHDKVATYSFPTELTSNAWALEGSWQVNEDKITSAAANAALKIHFNARKVFIVIGNNSGKPIKVNLQLNGEQLIASKGKDVENSAILVNKSSIYELVNAKQFTTGILKVTATEPGVEIYTFTFGN
ncbi:Thiol-disulfide oxidoreductase YkuV [Legionella massiliensis]|uniref:Thiol-disulfide oxidoreductase YkuV n=1 Tax=Legionella massiliensis TaxID=1034943 RepID=A0A078KX34_9GAMM|nr:cytochrome c biogenesis protein DipZ [Legionella massiliensis]CDZ77521.1 Thiol-disulfide oxidoreductase YkuV [Legionella massiliensis]CEE13259.1 Thiol-disulfide oxidoreductase ResA [Legionella massiliensis]